MWSDFIVKAILSELHTSKLYGHITYIVYVTACTSQANLGMGHAVFSLDAQIFSKFKRPHET